MIKLIAMKNQNIEIISKMKKKKINFSKLLNSSKFNLNLANFSRPIIIEFNYNFFVVV